MSCLVLAWLSVSDMVDVQAAGDKTAEKPHRDMAKQWLERSAAEVDMPKGLKGRPIASRLGPIKLAESSPHG